MLFPVLLFRLLPFAFAASFTSTGKEPKLEAQKHGPLDYAQIYPESELMKELSLLEDGPDPKDLLTWMHGVVANETPVSEKMARWVMLASKTLRYNEVVSKFFLHCVGKFMYLSLVRDVVDYDGSDLYINNYLAKYHLNQFTHLPASLREAVAQLRQEYIPNIISAVMPLLSNYSINHPRISQSVKVKWNLHRSVCRIQLICHSLGAFKMAPSSFAIHNFRDLAIIDEVQREFPDKMASFIAQLSPAIQNALRTYQTGEPPSETLWLARIERLKSTPHYKLGTYFDATDALLRDLIRFLFKHNREWIMKHFKELDPHGQLAYFLKYPVDTKVELLPDGLPSNFSSIAAQSAFTMGHRPFFESLFQKYGFVAVDNDLRAYSGSIHPKKAIHFIKFFDIDHQYTIANQSMNKFLSTISYSLRGTFSDDEVAEFLTYLFIKLDKTWIVNALPEMQKN